MNIAEVRARDGDRCIMPGCGSAQNLHVHHRIRRSQGGRNEPQNLVTLCRFHHEWVHSHPMAARKMGLLLSRHTDPATIPVDHHLWPSGPVLLDAELGFILWTGRPSHRLPARQPGSEHER